MKLLDVKMQNMQMYSHRPLYYIDIVSIKSRTVLSKYIYGQLRWPYIYFGVIFCLE